MALKEHGGFNKMLFKEHGSSDDRSRKVRKLTIKRFKHALFSKLFKELKRVAKEPKRA